MFQKIRSIALYAIAATVLFLFMLIAFNFSKAQTVQYFKINAGANYAIPNPVKLHTGVQNLERQVIFTPSCLYKFGTKDDGDINKLIGWGVGLTNKHSLRIGWNCLSDSGFDLYAYMHYDGKRWIIPKDSSSNKKRPDLIGRGFLPNLAMTLRISRARDAITFEVIQGVRKERLVIKFRDFPDGTGWYMYPYFGGTSKCPHDMTIIIY